MVKRTHHVVTFIPTVPVLLDVKTEYYQSGIYYLPCVIAVQCHSNRSIMCHRNEAALRIGDGRYCCS